MAHAQKPDFVFRRNGRVHLSRRRRHFIGLLAAEVCALAVVMFRGSVKSTGYPLPSPVSPTLPLPCFTLCHRISTGVYDAVSWMWKMRTNTVPVTTGALGTIEKGLDQNLWLLPGHRLATELQKVTLMSTAHSIHKVLGETALISCWDLDLQKTAAW